MKALMLSAVAIVVIIAAASAANATPNIICQYVSLSGHWYAFPVFTGNDGHQGPFGQLGTVSSGTANASDAVCSRVVSESTSGNLIQQVAYQIDPVDQNRPPDGDTCEFKGTKPFKIVSSKQLQTSSGEAHAVVTATLELIDYTPTSDELSGWEHGAQAASILAITNKCISLLPGSMALPGREK